MFRAFVCAVVGLALVAGFSWAEKKKDAKHRGHHAWFVSADEKAKPPTITFRVRLKGGKHREMTLPLAEHAKIFGEKHDPEKLDQFAEKMSKEKDKAIRIVEDRKHKHIVEIDDLPPRKGKPKGK